MNPLLILLWVDCLAAAIVILGLAVALVVTIFRSIPSSASKSRAETTTKIMEANK